MKFYIVDVFAEHKYQGNQLAVFLADGESLTPLQMQQIAKEINFAESSFILSDKLSDGGYKVRIFSPAAELPFAGHPSLGTAFILNMLYPGDMQKVLNLHVGQITVTSSANGLSMLQKQPIFNEIIPAQIVAEILNINVNEVNNDYPVQIVSTGLPALIVPLKTLEAVKKCRINHDKYQYFIDNVFMCNIMVFSAETLNPQNHIHARVFVDDPGFQEDPATGSANGNLAGYLLKYNLYNSDKIDLRVEQGHALGRPSLLHLVADKSGDNFNINVGGQVFMIAQGEWNI